jgi:hypothetical protein
MFCFSSSCVLYSQCCQCFWIVHFWLTSVLFNVYFPQYNQFLFTWIGLLHFVIVIHFKYIDMYYNTVFVLTVYVPTKYNCTFTTMKCNYHFWNKNDIFAIKTVKEAAVLHNLMCSINKKKIFWAKLLWRTTKP